LRLQRLALSGDSAEAVQLNELQEHRPCLSPERAILFKEPVAQWRCRLPQAWWLEKRPWRRWVAAGMSQRGGEVGVAGQA
jgi:hypothetical protein